MDSSIIKTKNLDNNNVLLTFERLVTKQNYQQVKNELQYLLGENFTGYIVDLRDEKSLSSYLVKILLNFKKSIDIENYLFGVIAKDKSKSFFEKTSLDKLILVAEEEKVILEKFNQ